MLIYFYFAHVYYINLLYLFSRWQTNEKINNTSNNNNNENSCIEVTCENGKKIIADQVLCTLPLGVLKENGKKIFDPSLPNEKTEAIDRLMFGTVDKIYLEYERPFLNPNVSEVMLLWDDRGLTDDERNDLSKTWFRKIYSFTKISETLLLVWISGKSAEFMEQLSTDEVSDTCTKILRRFLNDPFVPAPKKCIRTSWHSQPHTRGSYTSMAVGASQIDIETIAEPIFTSDNDKKISIAFAGEHTHSSFYSTVHGAYLTGRTAAQSLLDTRQNNNKEHSIDCEDTSDLSSWIQGISLN